MTEGPQEKPERGYGNIYTPHAGSMIISVQRESGLANRTIVLGPRKVRLLRFLASPAGRTILLVLTGSWIFFAIQAARVPLLSKRLEDMERDARRMDTLQLTLLTLQQRYEQVQRMLGVSTSVATPLSASRAGTSPADPAPEARADAPASARVDTMPTLPTRWPLGGRGFVTRGVNDSTPYSAAHPGLDIAVPVGTAIRAAGGGIVVEVGENAEYGKFVRLSHIDAYETIYGHTSRILVQQNQRVAAGTIIAHSGNSGRSTAPHLHFEVRRAGKVVDPMQLIKREQ